MQEETIFALILSSSLDSFRDQHNGSMSEILMSDYRDQHYGFRSKILSSVQCPLDSGQGLDKLLIYHLFFTDQCTICLCASLCSTERKAGCILYCYFISLWFFFIKLKKQRRISCINMNNLFNILTLVIKINNYLSYIATDHGDSIL